MTPIDSGDLQSFSGGSGQFTSIRKLLKPGENKKVKLLDWNKNTKTQYPIQGKDYCFEISLEVDGSRYLMSVASKDMIRQTVAAMYPNGTDKPLVPCWAVLGRRLERKTYESEGIITKGDPLPLPTDEDNISL